MVGVGDEELCWRAGEFKATLRGLCIVCEKVKILVKVQGLGFKVLFQAVILLMADACGVPSTWKEIRNPQESIERRYQSIQRLG